MELIKIINAKWADPEKTVLLGTATVNGFEGEWNFAVHDGYLTELGQSIWDEVKSGAFSPVADFIPPSLDEIRNSMRNLTARQLRLGLLSLGKLEAVPAAIAELPQPEKSQAEIEWNFATEFRRLHPLITQLVPILGLTDEQVDAVWEEFATV